MITANTSNLAKSPGVDAWFSDQVRQLGVDQLALETGTLDAAKESLYRNAMEGNVDGMVIQMRDIMKQDLINRALQGYLIGLSTSLSRVQLLAFDYNDSELLVWAQVATDDQEAEQALFRAEAKVNAALQTRFGVRTETVVVEEEDGCLPPSHYYLYKGGQA